MCNLDGAIIITVYFFLFLIIIIIIIIIFIIFVLCQRYENNTASKRLPMLGDKF